MTHKKPKSDPGCLFDHPLKGDKNLLFPGWYHDGIVGTLKHGGIPLRAWLAGQALAGLDHRMDYPLVAAKYAVKLADAVVSELDHKPEAKKSKRRAKR